MRRTVLIAILGLAVLAAPASATLTLYDSETNQQLASFEKASCRLNKKGGQSKIRFSAFTLPKQSTWSVAVFISNFDWHGFGAVYPLLYGDGHTIATVFGPGGPYSNEYPIPGTPPDTVGGGAIAFARDGKKISAGLAPASNESYTRGVVFAGAMKCKYPRRRGR